MIWRLQYVLMESVLQASLLAKQGHTSLSMGSVFGKKNHILAKGISSRVLGLQHFLPMILRLERLLHYDARIRGSKASCSIISYLPCSMDEWMI